MQAADDAGTPDPTLYNPFVQVTNSLMSLVSCSMHVKGDASRPRPTSARHFVQATGDASTRVRQLLTIFCRSKAMWVGNAFV